MLCLCYLLISSKYLTHTTTAAKEKKNDDIFYQVLQVLQLTHSMQQQIHNSRKVCVCMPDEIEKWKETEQLRRRKDNEVNKNII